jgi:glycerol uptake facilitator protein
VNPARDFGPRLAYAILPIKGKADPGWGYSWVPIVAPLIGASLAAGLSLILPAVAAAS